VRKGQTVAPGGHQRQRGRSAHEPRAARLRRRPLAAIEAAARGYSTLEFRPDQGARGSRQVHVEDLLCASPEPRRPSRSTTTPRLSSSPSTRSRMGARSDLPGRLVEIGTPSYSRRDDGAGAPFGSGTTNRTHSKTTRCRRSRDRLILKSTETSSHTSASWAFHASGRWPIGAHWGERLGSPPWRIGERSAMLILSSLGFPEPLAADAIRPGWTRALSGSLWRSHKGGDVIRRIW